jgi:hypothetical protein
VTKNQARYMRSEASLVESANSYGADVLAPLLRIGADAVEAKDAVYAERNRLVAALSKLLPSHLARHPDTDTSWEDDWRWIVVVNVPAGQMTWHIHDSEREMFNHLDVRADFAWDGHTTDEKYRRLGLLASWRDPIAAAVDAQLHPLKDELIAMGRTLAKPCAHRWVESPSTDSMVCTECGDWISRVEIHARKDAP